MLILWGYIIDMVGVLVCLLSRVTFEKKVEVGWWEDYQIREVQYQEFLYFGIVILIVGTLLVLIGKYERYWSKPIDRDYHKFNYGGNPHTGGKQTEISVNATCSSCGAEITNGSKFCRKCGEPVINQMRQCKNCGYDLQPDNIFCAHCGQKYE